MVVVVVVMVVMAGGGGGGGGSGGGGWDAGGRGLASMLNLLVGLRYSFGIAGKEIHFFISKAFAFLILNCVSPFLFPELATFRTPLQSGYFITIDKRIVACGLSFTLKSKPSSRIRMFEAELVRFFLLYVLFVQVFRAKCGVFHFAHIFYLYIFVHFCI